MDAWQDFCDRMAALGTAITAPPFPSGAGSERARVEGAHHLANQVATWLTWAVGHDSVTHPRFFRQNDLFYRWGGPNVDQVTRRATIDPVGTYRISGSLGACEDFILTMKDGDMHEGRHGVAFDTLGSDLGFGPGADVEIHLCGDALRREPGEGAWLAIPEGVSMLNIREYYWGWTAAAPATLVIERLDTQGTAPPPLTDADLAARLDKAARLVETSLTYWNDWVAAERAKLPPNTMGTPGGSAGGSSRIAYSFGFYELADDEALLVEAGPPPSPYWDIQLYSLGWFESFDFANRSTSLNHTQARMSADGRFRVVVAHTDPGVRNWLDTEGRPEGMLTHRWIGGPPAAITARLVPLAAVRDHLPADTLVVDPAERADEIRRRQAHAAWRYRT
jgi:hypothetical protein